MRIRNAVVMFAFFTLAFTACQKEVSEEPGGNPGGGNSGGDRLVRIQQGIDPDILNDTVRIISYNADNKISKIVDSLNEDTLICTYNASGKLVRLKSNYDDDVSFTYDAAGLLTQIDYDWAGSRERYVFYYNNGVLEKKELWSDLGSGNPHMLQGYFTYTFTAGNITTMKLFTKFAAQIEETTFTYGSQPNPFKDLSLFNYSNTMGTMHIINHETFFNKNLVTGSASSSYVTLNTYTFNNSQQITKIVSDVSWGAVYTWVLGYK